MKKTKPKIVWTAQIVDNGTGTTSVDIVAKKDHSLAEHLLFAAMVTHTLIDSAEGKLS